MLNIKHFLVFKTLYLCRNTNETADRLGISRQTLFNLLREIEDETNGQLYLKKSNPLQFTPFGDCFFESANRIITCYNTELEKVIQYPNKSMSIYLMGEIMSVFPDIRTLILRYQITNPLFQIGMSFYSSQRTVLEMVSNGGHECGFLFASANSCFPSCVSKQLLQYPLFAVVLKNHPLANELSITLDQLVQYDSIFFCDAKIFLPELYKAYSTANSGKNLLINQDLTSTCLDMLRNNELIRISLATEITQVVKEDVQVIPIRGLSISLQIVWPISNKNQKDFTQFASYLKGEIDAIVKNTYRMESPNHV